MRILLLLLAILAAGCGCAGVPTHDQVRATTLRIESATSVCSGTAIAPDKLLTAWHCLSEPLTLVNGQPVQVKGLRHWGRDWAVVTLARPMFHHWARMGPKPYQGERVRWWGNPMGEPDMYREGVVSRATPDLVVIDATICHGDSGAALFNDRGEIVGVVTALSNEFGCTFMLDLPA